MDLKIAVVEDDPQYRVSLETLLSHAPGFRLAGSFGSPLAALREAARQASESPSTPWDVVLMDLHLPDMNGAEATRQLKRILPGVPVIVLTVFEEPATILEAICSGADGYLLKKSPAAELLAQLRAITGGGAPLTSGVARTVLDLLRSKEPSGISRSFGRSPSPSPDRLDLTDREQEVLQCLVKGMAYKQAADHLGISIDTVRTHIRAVYRKLQVHSVAEAVTRAIRERIV